MCAVFRSQQLVMKKETPCYTRQLLLQTLSCQMNPFSCFPQLTSRFFDEHSKVSTMTVLLECFIIIFIPYTYFTPYTHTHTYNIATCMQITLAYYLRLCTDVTFVHSVMQNYNSCVWPYWVYSWSSCMARPFLHGVLID